MSKVANIEEISARLNAITPGEWQVSRSIAAPEVITRERRIAKVLYHGGSEDTQADKNAEFIAHAPTDIANLIHDLNSLRHIEGTVQQVFDANDALKAQLAACRAELQAAQELAELRHAERQRAEEDKQAIVRVANQLEREAEAARAVVEAARKMVAYADEEPRGYEDTWNEEANELRAAYVEALKAYDAAREGE